MREIRVERGIKLLPSNGCQSVSCLITLVRMLKCHREFILYSTFNLAISNIEMMLIYIYIISATLFVPLQGTKY